MGNRRFAALFAAILYASLSMPRALAVQEVFLGAGSITLGSSATSIQLAPGYGYYVFPWLQGTAIHDEPPCALALSSLLAFCR